MNSQDVPNLPDEAKQEFSEMTMKFFEKYLGSLEALGNIEVEVKYKSESETEPSESVAKQTLWINACYEGDGPGCGTGWRWLSR